MGPWETYRTKYNRRRVKNVGMKSYPWVIKKNQMFFLKKTLKKLKQMIATHIHARTHTYVVGLEDSYGNCFVTCVFNLGMKISIQL